MNITLHTVLLLIAVIIFIIAALGVSTERFSLTSAGLAFFAASFLF
jgi:hypothetical protein